MFFGQVDLFFFLEIKPNLISWVGMPKKEKEERGLGPETKDTSQWALSGAERSSKIDFTFNSFICQHNLIINFGTFSPDQRGVEF